MINNQTLTSLQVETRIKNMLNRQAENFNRLDETIRSSLHRADTYTDSHLYTDIGLTETAVMTIGLARLDSILEQGRHDLHGLISPEEFRMLSSTLQDEIAPPNELGKLITVFANDMNLDADSYKNSPFGPFVDKLLGLSRLQLLALQDLLEEYWNVAMHEMTCKEFLKLKGLLFA